MRAQGGPNRVSPKGRTRTNVTITLTSDVMVALARLAEDNLRSLSGQIAFIINEYFTEENK